MSGPHCDTCEHFYKQPLGETGECTDPDKAIYSRYGGRISPPPEVYASYECSNHKPIYTPKG